MQTVNWGLVSTANINNRLIPVIRASRRGRLAAVASRTQKGADDYAAEWNIPSAFPSYQAMLDSDSIDAVYISLPNHLHAEWTIKALEAGKHVLCEKPFALSLEEVDAMFVAAEASGCVLTEAFMYRHHPQTKIVAQWIQEGRLGDITGMYGTFSFKLTNPENVRLIREFGGGALWDIGIYPLSYAQFVMGKAPEWVLGNQWVGSSGVDEQFSGLMDYGPGRVAQFMCSFRAPFNSYVEISGTEGRMTLDRPFVDIDGKQHLIFHPIEGKPKSISVPVKELYLGEIEDMHASILDGEKSYLTLAETRSHVQTALALYESAEANKIVHLA